MPGILEQKRSRRDQCGNVSPGPLVSVDHEHAVAVTIDDFVPDIIFQVAHSTDGYSDFDAIVGRSDPEGRGTATGNAGDCKAVRVHLGPALQVVECPDAVPAFDGRGRIPARLPPPAI